MTIHARIRAAGGEVIRDEWRLRISRGRLKPDALAWIKAHQDALLAEVWPEYDAWVERAAIMEFDGGMSRDEAERAAYEGIAAHV